MAKIKQVDVTEKALFERAEKIAKMLNEDPKRKEASVVVSWHHGEPMRMLAAAVLCDMAEIKGDLRAEVIHAFQHQVPGWLGCNASQARQAREKKDVVPTVEGMADYVKSI